MRKFSKLMIILSHEGSDESEFAVPVVEMSNGSNSVQVSDLESALAMLPPGSEVTVVARGSVGNRTIHNLSRIIRESCVFVSLDLSAIAELTRVYDSPFRGNQHLLSIQFPSNLTTISSRALANCTNLVSVTIPATVEHIGAQAFAGCEKLSVLEFCAPSQWTALSDENSAQLSAELDNPEENAVKFSVKTGLYYNCRLQKST